jgi:hypothetical protein
VDWVGRFLTWLEPWLAYLLGLMQQGPLLALGVAVLAGVALGLSPVTYLFMPAVVGYVGGTKSTTRRRAAGLSLGFVLGITTVYVMLGALWGSLGLLLLDLLRRAAHLIIRLWWWHSHPPNTPARASPSWLPGGLRQDLFQGTQPLRMFAGQARQQPQRRHISWKATSPSAEDRLTVSQGSVEEGFRL